ESDLARELAAEEQRTGAVNAGLQARYAAEIRARVERAWIRPPTARPGLKCTVQVTQVPGGTVTDVKVGDCNGDDAVQRSIRDAVLRASPLPAPPDPSLFERKLSLVFAPND
ncbi:MAG: cell envelope integrity protein TolA, partial [Proteobacteria bacterium]|nr:cell envelope integrity protein TolA [Pseudomonadota bacterium]